VNSPELGVAIGRNRGRGRDFRGVIAARSQEFLRALWWIETQEPIEFPTVFDTLSTVELVEIFAAAKTSRAAEIRGGIAIREFVISSSGLSHEFCREQLTISTRCARPLQDWAKLRVGSDDL
jgi:hypothetical protein